MNQQKKLTRKEKAELSRQKAEASKSVRQEGVSKERQKIYMGLFAAAFGFLLYSSSINFNYTCDDTSVITSNYIVQKGARAIGEILKTPYRWGYWTNQDELYRPLPLIMFALEWQMFPSNPIPGHLINVLLYGLTGFVLFFFLSRLFSNNTVISLAATLLFLAHPIHTEVVANIKSRDEILGLLFGIGSMMWFTDYFQTGKRRKIIFSSISFFLALMSKESALPLLAVMPLTLIVFYNSKGKESLIKIIPVAIAAVVYLVIRAVVLGGIINTKEIAELDNILVSAPDYLSRLATAIYVLGRYLWLMVYPVHLSMDYSLMEIPILPMTDYRVLISLGAYTALLVYSVYAALKKDVIAYGVLFYLVTIFISSNLIITIGTVMAERLLYIPSLGLCIAFAAAMQKIFRSRQTENSAAGFSVVIKQNVKPLAVTACVLIFLIYRTLDRIPVWKDNLALYTAAVKDAPNSSRTHAGYAMQLRVRSYDTTLSKEERSSYLEQTIAEYSKSIEIYPQGFQGYKWLANVYWQKGDTAKAWELNEKALSRYYDADALNLKGVIYFSRGRYREAQDMFQQAVDREIVYSEGYKNLSICNSIFGDVDNEILNLRYAVEYDKTGKNLPTYYSMLAKAYRKKGDIEKAEIYSAKANAAGN
jgi:tetratricopeptide (TPR) repeat protein